MSMITEIGLFKACVEKPRGGLNLSELCLTKIKEPHDAKDLSEQDITARKALKLFHMAWSGVTKYMRTVCSLKGRAVELAGFGVFVPM